MIITIDGPAGAGKSTVAKALARRLGFRFLDTGAMYRAVALAAMNRGVTWDDPQRLADLAADVSINLDEDRVLLDGEDVTAEIRDSQVTAVVRHVADNPGVRQHLVRLQRRVAQGADVVTEGRDQGTVAFPQADCKIYLTATPEQRALRRWGELHSRGEQVSLDEVLAQQIERDRRDSARQVGRLTPAEDAVEVRTDGLSPQEVVDRLETLVRDKC